MMMSAADALLVLHIVGYEPAICNLFRIGLMLVGHLMNVKINVMNAKKKS